MADHEGVPESKAADPGAPQPVAVEPDLNAAFGVAEPAAVEVAVPEPVVAVAKPAGDVEVKIVVKPPPKTRLPRKAVAVQASGVVYESVVANGGHVESFDESDVGQANGNLKIARGGNSSFACIPEADWAGACVVKGPGNAGGRGSGGDGRAQAAEELLVIANRSANSLGVFLLSGEPSGDENPDKLPVPTAYWSFGSASVSDSAPVPYSFNSPSAVAANPRQAGTVLVVDRNPWIQQVAVTGPVARVNADAWPDHGNSQAFIGVGVIDGPLGGLAANLQYIVAGKASSASTGSDSTGVVFVFSNDSGNGFPFIRRILPYGADPTQLRVPEVIRFTKDGTFVVSDAAAPAGRVGLVEYSVQGKAVRSVDWAGGKQPERALRHDFLLEDDDLTATPLPANVGGAFASSLAQSAEGTTFTVFKTGNAKPLKRTDKKPFVGAARVFEVESVVTPFASSNLAGSVIALCLSLAIGHMSDDAVDHIALATLRYVALGLIFGRLLVYLNLFGFLLTGLFYVTRIPAWVKNANVFLGQALHIASITLLCIAIGMVQNHQQTNAYWYTVASLIFQLVALLQTGLDVFPRWFKAKLPCQYHSVSTFVRNEFDVRAVVKSVIATELTNTLGTAPTQDQIDAEFDAYITHRASAFDVYAPAGAADTSAPAGLFASLHGLFTGRTPAPPAATAVPVSRGTPSDVFASWKRYYGHTYGAVAKAFYKNYRLFTNAGLAKSRVPIAIGFWLIVPPIIMAIIDAAAANRTFNMTQDPYMITMVGAFMLQHFLLLGLLWFRFYFRDAELHNTVVFDFIVFVLGIGGLVSTLSTGKDNLSLVSGAFFSVYVPSAVLCFRLSAKRPDLFSKLVCIRGKASKQT